MLVEADISGDWDRRTDWAALAERSIRSAILHSGHEALVESEAEVSVKYTSDEEVRALNADWRGKDRPTNVLSFPMAEPDEIDQAPMLGDIVLAHGICAAEAAERMIPIESHAAHLLVHGTLHLLGFDHETDEDEAEAMEKVERRALAALGIQDPYKQPEVRT